MELIIKIILIGCFIGLVVCWCMLFPQDTDEIYSESIKLRKKIVLFITYCSNLIKEEYRLFTKELKEMIIKDLIKKKKVKKKKQKNEDKKD